MPCAVHALRFLIPHTTQSCWARTFKIGHRNAGLGGRFAQPLPHQRRRCGKCVWPVVCDILAGGASCALAAERPKPLRGRPAGDRRQDVPTADHPHSLCGQGAFGATGCVGHPGRSPQGTACIQCTKNLLGVNSFHALFNVCVYMDPDVATSTTAKFDMYFSRGLTVTVNRPPDSSVIV